MYARFVRTSPSSRVVASQLLTLFETATTATNLFLLKNVNVSDRCVELFTETCSQVIDRLARFPRHFHHVSRFLILCIGLQARKSHKSTLWDSTQGALENILCSRLLFHVLSAPDTHTNKAPRLASTMFSSAPDTRTSYTDVALTMTVSGTVSLLQLSCSDPRPLGRYTPLRY